MVKKKFREKTEDLIKMDKVEKGGGCLDTINQR